MCYPSCEHARAELREIAVPSDAEVTADEKIFKTAAKSVRKDWVLVLVERLCQSNQMVEMRHLTFYKIILVTTPSQNNFEYHLFAPPFGYLRKKVPLIDNVFSFHQPEC